MRIFSVLLVAALAAAPACKDKGESGERAKPSKPGKPMSAKKVQAKPTPPPVSLPAAPPLAPTAAGLPGAPAPADNATTPEKVMLGQLLFFDKRLSKDGSASCETCHVPEKGWTDGLALSTKVGGQVNTRHSPTLYNVAYAKEWYWDGRAPTLEAQVLAAWKGQLGADPAVVAAALDAIPEYKAHFRRAFGQAPSPDNIPKALAAFVRTIESGDSPWDRYEKGDKAAVSEDVVKGFEVFTAKASCALCHTPPLYTDMLFHNVGIGFKAEAPDPGRGKISNDPKETGAFKTPGLRSVTLTGPYFHDGSSATLEESVDYMLTGGTREKNPTIDEKLKPKKLTAQERDQLLAFLKALTPEPAAEYQRPKLPGGDH